MTFLKTFAKQINGKYIPQHYWHSDKVEIIHNGWHIIFDNYTHYTTSGGNSYEQVYTRVIVPFHAKNDFQFELYPKNLFSSIAKIFGAQDFEVGIPEFDKAFIIKTNNGFKTKALFSHSDVWQQIQSIQKINLQISTQKGIWEEKLPENEFELSFFTEGKIKNTEMLYAIRDMLVLVIEKLKHINSINHSIITQKSV